MLNYVNRVHVGLSTGLDSNNDTLVSLGRGDMLVLDSNMTPITSAPADNSGPRKSFYVALGTGEPKAPFILSSPIFGDSVKSYLGKETRAAAEQISYVGFNGTSGDIGAVVDGDEYKIIIAFKDRLRLIANRQTRQVLSAVAEGTDKLSLIESLIAVSNYSAPFSDPYGVKVEAVSNGTFSNIGLTKDPTVSKGSINVSFASNPNLNAGDTVRIQGSIYSIVSATTSTAVLSRPYQGASETIDSSVATTAFGKLTSITKFGLKISALSPPYVNPEIDKYEKIVFTVGVSESFTEGAVTDAVSSDLGQGTYEQVKEMEFQVQHNLGNSNLTRWPVPVFDFHAVKGTSYNVIQITASDKHEGDLQGMIESPVGLTLAFSSASNAQADNITDILDALIPNATAIGPW